MKIWSSSRCTLLQLLRVFRSQKIFSPLTKIFAALPNQLSPKYRTLRPPQAAVLEAITEQIIPADQDPGAREAGVVTYIDNILGGEQSEKMAFCVAGLKGTDETSLLMFGRAFAQLEVHEQEKVLKQIELGLARSPAWKDISSAEFFATVWNHTLEGFYGPPQHGGNKDYTSWKMVGFPEHSGTM